MKKKEFTFYYFQECKQCGYRLSVDSTQFGLKEALVNYREDFKCLCGNQFEWEIICNIKSEDILPKI